MSADHDEPRAPAPATLEPSPLPARERRGCLGSAAAALGVVVGAIYVANPTFGLFELIPDNVPLIGNLDEAAATTLLILGLQYLFGKGRRE